jgi:hypothetical protein
LTASLAFILTVTRAAAADPSSKIVAEELFERGRTLLEAGDVDAACDKLAESQRLDPAGGTALLLGWCLERQGRLASAWATFHTARALAARDGRQDRIAVAEERLRAIAPGLAHVVVSVPADARIAGMEVSLDSVKLGDASYDVPLPVDPGSHGIRATAPGYRPFATSVDVPPAGNSGVTVRPLEREETTSRALPLIAIGSVGAGALALTTYFGIAAIGAENGKPATCQASDSNCLSRAQSLESQRSTDVTVATVAASVAGAAAAGELVLLLLPRRPRVEERAWRVAPFAVAGVSMEVRF